MVLIVRSCSRAEVKAEGRGYDLNEKSSAGCFLSRIKLIQSEEVPVLVPLSHHVKYYGWSDWEFFPTLCEEPQFMAEYPYTRVPLLRNDERARGNVLAKVMGAPPHERNPPKGDGYCEEIDRTSTP